MPDEKGVIPKKDYFRVKNDWFDALIKMRLPGNERQCLDYIIRRTYGWQKRSAQIPINDFVSATGILKTHVSRCLKALKLRKMIIVTKNGNYNYLTYEFNKYFNKWITDISPKTQLPKMVTMSDQKWSQLVTRNGNNQLPEMVTIPIKEQLKNNLKNNKRTSNKSKNKIFDDHDIPYLLSQTLIDQIKRNLPNSKDVQNGNREKTIQRWAADIDKMIRLDNRPVCDIWNMIIWCQYDDFWFKNILSGSKLRKQYDKLAAAITSEVRRNDKHKTSRQKLLEEKGKWMQTKMMQKN